MSTAPIAQGQVDVNVSRLLPCPFCGVELKKYSGCACGSCKGGVWHDNKDCVFGSKVFSGHMTELDMVAFAEKWNKRANV